LSSLSADILSAQYKNIKYKLTWQTMEVSNQNVEAMVKVFVRKFDKRTKSIRLPAKIDVDHLKEIVTSKLNIPVESLVLYTRGEEMHDSIALAANAIIHAIDFRNVDREHISIVVKCLENGS
jgi:hypothetical protein